MNPLPIRGNSIKQTISDLRKRRRLLSSQVKDHVAVAKRHHAMAMVKKKELDVLDDVIKTLNK